MTTRDGVDLLADVYLPPDEGPHPTLLYRVRGSKDSSFITGTLMLNPVVAADRGYAVVVQQVRGRADSGGEWHPFIYERDDGIDAVEWVLSHEWCDGNIGVYGSAYAGATALQIVATGHPAVKACVAFVTGANYHDGWIYTSGAFELGWDNFWAYLTAPESLKRLDREPAEKAALAEDLFAAMKEPMARMEALPLTDQPALPDLSPHFWTWLEHPLYDDYWRATDVVAAAGDIHARVLNITGWWDNFLGSHLQLYEALADHSPSGADQRLVIGPWDHFTYVGVVPTTAGDRNFGPAGLAGAPIVEPMTLAWMDRWLRGAGETDDTAPGVRYFRPGADRWETAPRWPMAGQELRLFLHSGGAANSSSGNGSLSEEPPGEEPPDTYHYDPADPVPTVGGRTLMPTVVEAGIRDQSRVAARGDVLVYDTEPLAGPLEIAGPVAVELWAATDAADTDFTAKLVDVAPDGYCAIVADGIVRGRHRESYERNDWLEPGTVYELTVDLWAVAWRFEAGHVLRLEIASSNFPRFDRNLNVPIPPGRGALGDAVVAHQTIFHDAARPSALIVRRRPTP